MASINLVQWRTEHSFKRPCIHHPVSIFQRAWGEGQLWQAEFHKMMGEIGKNMSLLFVFLKYGGSVRFIANIVFDGVTSKSETNTNTSEHHVLDKISEVG
jgi:hypothetical protein